MSGSIPWIEKYRPDKLDDLILDPQIETQIKAFVDNIANNHLIITGVPGIGKTSTAKCIAKRILGENVTEGYLELNAAEDRGVKSMSVIIPPFCKKMVNFTEPKIILLDEADNLTAKCQHDINSMIKKFGNNTKFIFTCNESNKIIEDIQSVCRIIRYKQLTNDQIVLYLKKICEKEDIPCNKSGLVTICYISGGDMRMAINNLQLVAYTYNKIEKNLVLKICKLPDPDEVKKIIILCLEGNLIGANDALDEVIKTGYYYLDIVTCFIYVLTTEFYLDEFNKPDKKDKIYLLGKNKKEIEETRINLVNTVQQTKIIISSAVRSKLQLTAMICRLTKVD